MSDISPQEQHALDTIWGISLLLDTLKSEYGQQLRDADVILRDAILSRTDAPAPQINWSYIPTSNHGGRRMLTSGIVIHSTRGGAPRGTEYDATLRWFQNPSSQSSSHAVIGYDGRCAVVVHEDYAAWHAEEMNAQWLGVELEQPRIGDDISDVQYEALAWWCRQMAQTYDLVLEPGVTLLEHKDTAQGRRNGKSDIGTPFDINRLAQLL